MGLVKEPLNVDFEVDPKPLTQKEKEAISQYISAYKARKVKQTNKRVKTSKSKVLA